MPPRILERDSIGRDIGGDGKDKEKISIKMSY